METDIFMKNKKIKGKCFRDLLILLVNFLRIQVKKRTLKSKEIVTVKLYIYIIQRVTEISTLILTGNKTHQEQQLL
jgi:hypothetical protein